MSSDSIQHRQAGRRARKKAAKRVHNVTANQKKQPQKYNLWCPKDNGYTLLREGTLLKSSPKAMHEVGSLKESFLWHFKSTSGNISRITSLDKCSLYEAVFKVNDVEEGAYVYPTHDQLAQIYKGFNMNKATTVLENGAPYITDKRLRRYIREKRTRSNNTKKTQEKKKKRRRKDHSSRMIAEKDRNDKAPVKIDNKMAFVTPKNTIRSIKNAGMWNTRFNTRSLPKRAKMQIMVTMIDEILNSVGEVNALTFIEREEISNKFKENEEDENLKILDSMENSALIFDKNEASMNELLDSYFPEPKNTEKYKNKNDDDDGMNIIYDDLAITSVELAKRSERQKMVKDMGSYVSNPFYREKKMEMTRKFSKSQQKKRSRHSDCADNDDIDKLFAINSDEEEQYPLKKNDCITDNSKNVTNSTISPAHKNLLLVLENKGMIPDIPDLWYQMYDQLGPDLSVETIRKTDEYSKLSLILNNGKDLMEHKL